MANMNNQGKRPEQYTDSARIAWYGVVGMIILLIVITLLGGCRTIKPTKKCCEKDHVITEWESDREIRWYSTTEKK